jgi:hypothetical protein
VKEDFNIDRGYIIGRTETQNYSPLLSVNFKLLRSLSFSGSYTFSRTNSRNYEKTTGALRTETVSERKSIAFSMKYSFSSPGGISIPLFGKLKFKSDVDISINVKKNSNISETSSEGKPFVKSVDKSDFSVGPVISYTFSRQVKGGITARWQDNNDAYANRRSHVRELQMWAEIRF